MTNGPSLLSKAQMAAVVSALGWEAQREDRESVSSAELVK